MPFSILGNPTNTTQIINSYNSNSIIDAFQFATIIAINFSFHTENDTNFHFNKIDPHTKKFIHNCLEILIDKSNNTNPQQIHQLIVNNYNKHINTPDLSNAAKEFKEFFILLYIGIVNKNNLINKNIQPTLRNLQSNNLKIKLENGYLKVFNKPYGANSGFVVFKLLNKNYLDNQQPINKNLNKEQIVEKVFNKYLTPHLIKETNNINEFLINKIHNTIFPSNQSKINLLKINNNILNDIKFKTDYQDAALITHAYSNSNKQFIFNKSEKFHFFIQDLMFNYFVIGNVDTRIGNMIAKTSENTPSNDITEIQIIDKEDINSEFAKKNLNLLQTNQDLKLTLKALVISNQLTLNGPFKINYNNKTISIRKANQNGRHFSENELEKENLTFTEIFNLIENNPKQYSQQFLLLKVIDLFNEQELQDLLQNLIEKFNQNSTNLTNIIKDLQNNKILFSSNAAAEKLNIFKDFIFNNFKQLNQYSSKNKKHNFTQENQNHPLTYKNDNTKKENNLGQQDNNSIKYRMYYKTQRKIHQYNLDLFKIICIFFILTEIALSLISFGIFKLISYICSSRLQYFTDMLEKITNTNTNIEYVNQLINNQQIINIIDNIEKTIGNLSYFTLEKRQSYNSITYFISNTQELRNAINKYANIQINYYTDINLKISSINEFINKNFVKISALTIICTICSIGLIFQINHIIENRNDCQKQNDLKSTFFFHDIEEIAEYQQI